MDGATFASYPCKWCEICLIHIHTNQDLDFILIQLTLIFRPIMKQMAPNGKLKFGASNTKMKPPAFCCTCVWLLDKICYMAFIKSTQYHIFMEENFSHL